MHSKKSKECKKKVMQIKNQQVMHKRQKIKHKIIQNKKPMQCCSNKNEKILKMK